MKVCCIERLGTACTCADCPDYPACPIIRDFHGKGGFKYKKYKESLEFIRCHGYGRFLKLADAWKGPYGKLD